MKVYDIDNKVLYDVPVTSQAVHEQELSKSDYVQLVWTMDEKKVLPAGSYIIPFEDGLKYRLLEPYAPNQNNEIEYKYEPQFQHPLMWLSKVPFTYTTVSSDGTISYTSQDWPYLGLTVSLLQVVVDRINELFGFTTDDTKFTYQIVGTVDTTVNVTFHSTDILSALSSITSACKDNTCEWHISWENKCLYFGQISFSKGEDTPVLKVGDNIGKVSVNSQKDAYYNVFFPQGSTRNISSHLTNGKYIASSLRLGLNFPKSITVVNAFATITKVETADTTNHNTKFDLDMAYLSTYFNQPLAKYGDNIYAVQLKIDTITVNARVENGSKDSTNVHIYSECLTSSDDADDNTDFDNFAKFLALVKVGAKVYFAGGVNKYSFPDANKETTEEAIPVDYPDGTIDTRKDKNEPKQTLALTFDSVYPHVDLYVYNVRSKTDYLKKRDTNENVVDSNGKKIKYSTWYFRLAYPLTTKLSNGKIIATTTDNGVTHYWYDYFVDPSTQVIDGYKLAGQFTANTNAGALEQPLLGQPASTDGFEMECYQSDTTITLDDGTTVKKGDYTIIYVQQSNDETVIIPTTKEEGLYPRGNAMPSLVANKVILYNIAMGKTEIKAAQDELLEKTKKEIKRRQSDLNNYSFSSYPDIFADDTKNPKLYIGKKVTFNDGNGYTLSTRVIKLSTKLDYSFEQEITVGNQKIKGTTSQLKKDIDTILSGNAVSNGNGGLNTTQVRNIIKTYGSTQFLSKTRDDSTAHKLTMGEVEVKGALTIGTNGSYSISKEGVATLAGAVADYFKSPDFQAGTAMGFDGTGYGVTLDTDGEYTLEIDNLVARMKMIVAELEVHEMSFIGGTVVMSSCGNRVDRVEALDADGGIIAKSDGTKPTLTIPSGKTADRFRCYFLASDGDRQIKNEWTIGQLARAKTNNIAAPGNYKDYQNRDYWRLVVGVSSTPVFKEGKDYHYIDLSNSTSKDIALTDAAGTTRHVTLGGVSDTLNSLPFAGDNIIGLGHCWDSDRQNAAVLSVVALGWTLYKGIDHYDLPSANIVNKFGIDETIVTTDHFILRPYAAPSETETVAVVRGAYSDTASYGHNDLVTCDGQTWIASGVAIGKTIKGQKPSATSPYWSLAAAKGIQGEKGDAGADGSTYDIYLSASVLKGDSTGKLNGTDTVSVTAKVVKTTGGTAVQVTDTDEAYFTISRTEDNGDLIDYPSGRFTVKTFDAFGNGVKTWNFALYVGGTFLKTVTLPVVRDGQDGDGEPATVYTIEAVGNSNNSGMLKNASTIAVTLTGNLKLYKTVGSGKTEDSKPPQCWQLTVGGTAVDGTRVFNNSASNNIVSYSYNNNYSKDTVPGSATISVYKDSSMGELLASLVVPISLNPGAIVDVNSKLGTIESTTMSMQNDMNGMHGTIETIKQGQGRISLKVQDLARKGGNILPGGNVNGLFNKKYSVFVSDYFTVEEGKTYTVTANVYKDTAGSHVIDIIAFRSDWTRQYRGQTSETDPSNKYCYSFTAGATEQLRVGFYERTSSGDDPGSYEGVHLNWVRVDEGDWTGEARLSEWGPSDRETDAVNLLPDPGFTQGIGFTDGMGERNTFADNMGDYVPWVSKNGDGTVLFDRGSQYSGTTSNGLRYLVPFRGPGTYFISYDLRDQSRTQSWKTASDDNFYVEIHPCGENGRSIEYGGSAAGRPDSGQYGTARISGSKTFGETAGNGVRIAYLELRVFLHGHGSIEMSHLCVSKSDHYIYWNANAVSESRKNDAKLLATGINIEDRKITLTSDNTEVRTNSGKTVAVFDENGIVSQGLKMKDANGNTVFDARNGDVSCKTGTFDNINVKNSKLTDVSVNGSIRSAFKKFSNTLENINTDNYYINTTGGGWIMSAGELSGTVSDIGRTVKIFTNGLGGAEITLNNCSVYTEFGQELSSSIVMPGNSYIELLGIGTDDIFKYWQITNRGDVGKLNYVHGVDIPLLAYGYVEVNYSNGSWSTKLYYDTFDGSALTLRRDTFGYYILTLPSTWFFENDVLHVITTPYGPEFETDGTRESVRSANVMVDIQKHGRNIVFICADDNTLNDQSFFFEIKNLNEMNHYHLKA